MSNDRSFLYGDALFETVRVEEQGPIALSLHVARFKRSAEELGYSDANIHAGVSAILGLESAAAGVHRVTISRDDADAPFVGEGGITHHSRPLDVAPSRPRLCLLEDWYFPSDKLAEHKTTSYLRCVETRRRAFRRGADDALRVSNDGFIGEASAANVFIVFPSGLATPPVRGLLPGVTRQRVLEKFDVLVRPIHVDELSDALEVVLTNAALLAVAAQDIEGRELGYYRAMDMFDALAL